MKYIIILLVLLSSIKALAQPYQAQYTTIGNGDLINVETIDIVSDFGRRYSYWETKGTDRWKPSPWHPGLDINMIDTNDMGFGIPAFDSGRVELIVPFRYKKIYIKGEEYNWGYGHIFDGNEYEAGFPAGGMLSGGVNDFVLKKLEGLNVYGIINLETDSAYSTIEGNIIYNQDTFRTKNIVYKDELFAPIGGSGGFSSGAHIHLYLLDSIYADDSRNTTVDNTNNPLQLLSYTNPEYEVDIDTVYNLKSEFLNANYSGRQKASIKVRVEMSNCNIRRQRYDNAVMDIDDIGIWIKRDKRAVIFYENIKGSKYYSKVDYGGKIGKARYPNNNEQGDISWYPGKYVNRQFNGSPERCGMEPHAYHNADYDYYYFSDFYTRIHKDDSLHNSDTVFAWLNEDARYPDGDYNLLAYARTIKDKLIKDSTSTTITIDNFMPYVKKIEVRNSLDELVYNAEWVKERDSLRLTTSGSPYIINPYLQFSMKVWTSEEMDSVNICSELTFNLESVVDGQEWSFFSNPTGTSGGGTISLRIEGADLAGNPLIDMPDYKTPQPNTTIALANMPVREQNGFSNTAIFDTSEVVYLPEPLAMAPEGHTPLSGSQSCSPGNKMVLGISCSNNAPRAFETISFTGSASGEPDSWYWDFGDSTFSTSKNPAHYYETPGTYTVTLWVAKGHYSAVKYMTDYITVTESESIISNFTCSLVSGYTVQFTNTTLGGPVTNWRWDFGDGRISTEKNPVHTYTKSGSFNVMLTASNGADSDTEQKENVINVLPSYIETLDVKEQGMGGSQLNYNRNVEGNGIVFARSGNSMMAGTTDLDIDVSVSLPVFKLKLELVDGNGNTIHSENKYSTSGTSQRAWQFTIPREKLAKGVNTLRFSGKDEGGTELLKVKELDEALVWIDQPCKSLKYGIDPNLPPCTTWETDMATVIGSDKNYSFLTSQTDTEDIIGTAVTSDCGEAISLSLWNNGEQSYFIEFNDGNSLTIEPGEVLAYTYNWSEFNDYKLIVYTDSKKEKIVSAQYFIKK